MKRLILLLLFGLCISYFAKAQVKIGDNPQNIDPASVLELESTDKVLVITRVTTAQMNAIVPLQGAMVYNTDVQGVHYFDGTQWVNIGSGGGTGTGGPLTADPIVNDISTIVITPTAAGDNLEVAENSIGTLQIQDGSINGFTDIQPQTVGLDQLADQSVTQEKLSENSVGAFALDNDNIGVSAFNNDVGYITGAAIVSGDAGNALQIGTDSGAFYDETPLISAIEDNTDAIALDNDQSASNEIQNLTLNGSVIGLTDTAGTIDIGPLLGGGGSDDQNIGPVTFNLATNELSIGIENGNAGTVDLSPLAGGGGTTVINSTATVTVAGTGTAGNPYELTAVGGGGGGTTEVVDGTFLIGTGTGTDPFTIAPGGADQILRTNTAGDAVDWVDLPTGSAAITDATIEGDGTSAATALSLADDAVNTDKIAPGGADQILRTNTAGDAVTWVDLPTGSAAITDATIEGDGTSAATALSLADDAVTTAKILDANVTEAKIAPGGADQILRTNTAGDAVTWVDLPTGSAAITDATIEGDGSSAATALSLADDAVTTAKILDANVTEAKIAPGGADQILRTNTAGDAVTWVDLPTGSAAITDATIDGDGSSAATPLSLADNSVTLPKIAPNGAVNNGDIIRWNADLDGAGPLTDAGWEVGANSGHTGDPKSLFYAGSDGAPTQFFHPNGRPSLYWDYEGRTLSGISYGALAIGVDGDPQQGTPITLSNEVKVHIAEQLPNRISYSLLLHNSGDVGAGTTGTGVGMLFSSDRFNAGKGSLIFERRDAFGVGDFHFLQNNTLGQVGGPDLTTDKSFTITREKNIRLYGGIDIDGTGPGTGLGTAGQVLSSTGTGVQWITGGGTSQNLSTDNLTQDSGENRTYDLNGGELYFTGTGNIGVGTINPQNKFHVAGEIRSEGFNATFGTVGAPAYSFASATTPDADTGMYRPAADQIGFSVGGFEALRFDEYATGETTTIINGRLELGAEVFDLAGNPGTTGQVLSSTGTGVEWIDNPAGSSYTAGAGLSLSAGNEFSVNNLNGDVTGAPNATVIAPNAITPAKIQPGGDGEVLTTNGGAVTWGTITSGPVNTDGLTIVGNGTTIPLNIPNNGIGTAQIADSAIEQDQIATGAVGQVEIAENGVSTAEIADNTILDIDINANAGIAGSKINPLFNLDVQTSGSFISGTTTYPDYVFQYYFNGQSELDRTYKLAPLMEVAKFIKLNHHLPGIKSAAEVERDNNQWNLTEGAIKNLEKIEELFIHTIEQEEKINSLKSENDILSKELRALKKDLNEIKTLLKNK